MIRLIWAIIAYIFIIAVAMFLLCGCVKYVDKEVLVPYEVKIPTPMKCEYEMPKEIKPNLSNLKSMHDTLTEILKTDREIRNSLYEIPCLNIK